jgi:hypothetical protein
MNPQSLTAAKALIDSAMTAEQRRAMTVSDFKPLNKNTVRGVFTLILPSGMKINGCLLHQRVEGQYWIGLPSIPREVAGKKIWSKVIEFDSKATHERFQAGAVAAVAKHLNGGPQ